MAITSSKPILMVMVVPPLHGMTRTMSITMDMMEKLRGLGISVVEQTEIPSLKGTEARFFVVDEIGTSYNFVQFEQAPELTKAKPYWRKNERW